MNGKAIRIGAAVIIALAGIGGLVLHILHGAPPGTGTAALAPADLGLQLGPQLAGVQITPPDDQFQPGAPMTCATGAGDIALRCALTFIDNARFGQPAYVVVYVLTPPGSLAGVQAQVDKNLARLPGKGLISASETDKISAKSGNDVFNIPVNCEQALNDPVHSYAVCLAPDIDNTVVATAIFPGTWSNVTDVSQPPDILRAEALEASALIAVYATLPPPAS